MSRHLNFFHGMAMQYTDMPPVDEFDSAWITYSNQHFDPVKGHKMFKEQLSRAALAEQLGYDGVLLNEHHQTPCGMPDVNVVGAHVVGQTEKISVLLLGNPIPLHGNPMRVAESVAMLDVFSGGRVISGFVRGQGMEYISLREDPSTSRERFWEAHDLIIRSWTEPGPFEWVGEHYDIPYVNPWPTTYQKPHPPIWIPGQGSKETIEACARMRYPFAMVFSPVSFTRINYQMYRDAAAAEGYEPDPEQLAFAALLYVAETDEQAEEEVGPYAERLMQSLYKFPPPYFTPPGYFSGKSLGGMIRGMEKFGIKAPGDLTFRDMVDQQIIVVGSPKTVVEKLSIFTDELGAGTFLSTPPANLPADLMEKNMRLFSQEVMPHFRPPGNKPHWERGLPVPGTKSMLAGWADRRARAERGDAVHV
jgi:alkanesulfonate monooxygenase SsuD/methylene tetrahydromethanopterin reductase-like flavin-dependent oxidoreductase (luciferase family)